MTIILPKVKLRALVSFPSGVDGGTGIDVSVENGNYTIDLDYSEFVPGTSAPPGSYTVVWDPANNVYTLVPIASVGGGAPSDANPLMDGVAAPGLSALYSRGDHVHPSDTSKADVASLGETIDDRVAGLLVAGANVTLTYNDPANTLTIASSGGGGGVPATAVPLVEAGTGAVGVSTKYAREDHVHPLGPGGGGGASVLVSATPPAGAADNSLWWESDTGNLYIRYNDGTGPSQWVIVTPNFSASALNAVTYVPQTLTSETVPYGAVTQRSQARMNIYAAPFDALAYNGMQVNGSMDVSQENGISVVSVPGGPTKHIIDGFDAAVIGATRVANVSQTAISSLPGFTSCLNLTCATGGSLGTGDSQFLFQAIEGYRWSRLAFGSANAQPVIIAFWVYSSIVGTMAVSLRNGGTNRSYIVDVAVVIGWQYKTVAIPGDIAGTWAANNTVGAYITFSFGGGSTFQSAANVWAANGATATAATTNFFATAGNQMLITGVVVLPGIEAPSAARSPLIMRPYDQELLTCQRYYQISGALAGVFRSAANLQVSAFFAPTMRITPTVAIRNGTGTANIPGVSNSNITSISSFGPASNAGGFIDCATSASATGTPTPGQAAPGAFAFDARL